MIGTSVEDDHSPGAMHEYIYQRKRTESGSQLPQEVSLLNYMGSQMGGPLVEVTEAEEPPLTTSFNYDREKNGVSAINTTLSEVNIDTPPSSSASSASRRRKVVSRPSNSHVTSGFKVEEGSGSRSTSKSPSRFGEATPVKLSSPAIATPKKRLTEKPQDAKEVVNLVVVGHVDAGKSTLMGHLLYQLGNVNQRTMHKYKEECQKLGKASFHFAWVLDESEEERNRGVTMDIAKTRFHTRDKEVVLLDAPGHKDFIPNMISGATQADVALLVVNAARGEFEAGFELGGQTREHAILLRSLGVGDMAIVVNKLDMVQWSEERFNEIKEKMKLFLKQTGFPARAPFVPCSGLEGCNLAEAPPADHPLLLWYKGPTLLDVINTFSPPSRSVEKSLRFCISDVFKGMGGGTTVGGRVETGALLNGDRVIIMPNGDSATVKSIQKDEGIDVGVGYAGDQRILTLKETVDTIGLGHVLCHPESVVPIVERFRARIVLFNLKIPITPGFPVVIHVQDAYETGTITKLVSQLDKGSGEVVKNKPRVLGKNTSGIVEIQLERPVCLEKYADFRELGRITLRYSGTTLGAGVVTDILR